ncbi:MAG: ABC transporter permease [Firmicutes bacterium]|nr:ABC transporter permease [Bacillota bacterium]
MVKYIKGFFKYRFLLWELVKKGIKLKYRRSYLGIVWSLIEPILTTIVLVIVFGTLFNNKDPQFPLYVVSGRLLYTFFQSGTKQATTAIRNNSSMIKKVYVPKYLYPLAGVLFNFIIFLISLIVLVLVMIYTHTLPTLYLWQFLPALAILLVFTIGCGMFLSALHVFFRDVEYLWNVMLMLIMYMSAIFYFPDRLLKSRWAFVIQYNPLYCIIDIFRGSVMGYQAPAWDFGYTIVVSLMAVFLGTYLFWKTQDRFILHI